MKPLRTSQIADKFEKGNFTQADFRDLLKYTLARCITFNARRGGEVQKLTIKMCEMALSGIWRKEEDIQKIENKLEQVLAARLVICYLEGKKKLRSKDSIVPILFTEEVVRGIKLLKKHCAILGAISEFIFFSGLEDKSSTILWRQKREI